MSTRTRTKQTASAGRPVTSYEPSVSAEKVPTTADEPQAGVGPHSSVTVADAFPRPTLVRRHETGIEKRSGVPSATEADGIARSAVVNGSASLVAERPLDPVARTRT